MSRRHVPRSTAAFCAVALISVGAACGEDEDDRLSESGFLEQANQVCAESNARIERAAGETFGSANGNPDPEALMEFFEVLKTEIRGQIDDVTALRPPSDLEAEIGLAMSTANAEYDQMVNDIDEDPRGFAESENDPFAETNAMLVEIGLTECSG